MKKKNGKEILKVLCTLVFLIIGLRLFQNNVILAEEKMESNVQVEELPIDEEHFPDNIFQKYLSNNFDLDKNGILSKEEIENVKEILIIQEKLKDLTGIQYFYNLEKLVCFDNRLTSLDLSYNTALIHLDCWKNKLTSLDLSHNTALTELDCSDNNLTFLDLGHITTLTSLVCDNNELLSLDPSYNTELTLLYCDGNELTSLDVSHNTALIYLFCSNNELTSLDLSYNTVLDWLSCYSNQLTSLDLSHNTVLTQLSCWNNKLTYLDLSHNATLISLDCSNNKLNFLDIRNINFKHTDISIYNNPLRMLVLDKEWETFYVKIKNLLYGDVAIESLNISNSSNITFVDNNFIVTDKTQPATYTYTYHNGKPDAIALTITICYLALGETLPPLPELPKLTPTPIPSLVPPTPEIPTDFDIKASCKHLFFDYEYKKTVSGTAIVLYGNGGIQKEGNTKKNTKLFMAYTDITPSYQYTINNDKIKAATGKVIAGLTLSDKKPNLVKGKIVDASATKIATAKVKNGVVTVTATGKAGGTIYLWIMDTGKQKNYECCPIHVKLAPKKMEIQNTSGSKLKNLTLAAGVSETVYVVGWSGETKTEDCTYTATVDAKSQSFLKVEPGEHIGQFKITALKHGNGKKTNTAVTFTCDQNGKKLKFTVTITK